MKLSKSAILALKGCSKDSRERIATAMKVGLKSVNRWIAQNQENGPLTTLTALQVIKEETGLEEEILDGVAIVN